MADQTHPTLWPIEQRILAYLDQRGHAHREAIVFDLAKPGTRIGDGIHNGSNAGVPRLIAAWSRRLVKRALIEVMVDRDGYYSSHRITPAGRAEYRNSLAVVA